MVGELMRAYVDAFNRHDLEGMLATLHDEVVHELNEGGVEVGIDAFREFRKHMDACYREQLRDVTYFENGDRGAIECFCDGEYLKTDGGLPEARGQRYSIRVAVFYEVREGKLGRVTSFYNLREWIAAVSK
ncbi:hypothetical protein CCB80_04765 [Armatimonadetes bacterium Uphvl-Ar1]|nr:hypothetical protein CCB80_04765 [Armatimonadetes bacterium Uphvl-Ar1]